MLNVRRKRQKEMHKKEVQMRVEQHKIFIHYKFIQQIPAEHQLHPRHCVRCWAGKLLMYKINMASALMEFIV
jgi:hypothetical protein